MIEETIEKSILSLYFCGKLIADNIAIIKLFPD